MQKRIRESYSKEELEYHIFMTECYMNISLNVRIQILEIRKCTMFFFPQDEASLRLQDVCLTPCLCSHRPGLDSRGGGAPPPCTTA